MIICAYPKNNNPDINSMASLQSLAQSKLEWLSGKLRPNKPVCMNKN